MPLLTPEAQLLVLAIRPPTDDNEQAIRTLVNTPIRWGFLGELAEREKLLPVLWHRLQAHADHLPAEIAGRIRAQASVTEFRLAMMELALRKVVQQIGGDGIPVVLLKGAALATTVYRDFAARPMGDLDILVPAADAARAWQGLADRGWTPELTGGERFYEGHHHLVALIDPDGLQIVLEIHRAMLPLAGPFLLEEGAVWRDRRAVALGAAEASVPSDQHQLLHLCVHFAWSNMLFSGLGRTMRDVAAIVAATPIDWERFVSLAQRARAGSCAYWTLAMAAELTAVEVPAVVLRRLRPPGTNAGRSALMRVHVAAALGRACPSIHVRRLLWAAAIRPGAEGHGDARPWQVGEAFAEALQALPRMGLAARVRSHLVAWRSWLRFARDLMLPARIM